MYKIIVNADDFGYSRGMNYGVEDSYRNGILTSATLMTNMPGFKNAVEITKRNPGLGVGVHLVLTCGKPILKTHKTIVDLDGSFHNLNFYKGKFLIDYNEVYMEWKAQIEKFISSGLIPTHLDSHHHINSYTGLNEIMLKLSLDYNLPLRNNTCMNYKEKNIKTTDYFVEKASKFLKLEEEIFTLYEKGSSIEVMTHPAYLDKSIIDSSSLTYGRVADLSLLQSKFIKDFFNKNKRIKLITFKDL